MPDRNGLTCAVCQPHYLPWIGYFEMIDRVDLFVFLDDVQFIKREWKNRNRIRKEATSEETKWLTVPVVKQPWPGARIDRTPIARDQGFWERHLEQVRAVYAKTEYAASLLELLETLTPIAQSASDLAELNVGLTRAICAQLGITTRFRRASELAVPGGKTEKIAGLCSAVGARRYLANDASAVYLDRESLARIGVEVEFQGYAHPRYPQRHAGGELPFLSHLSVIDLIANLGPRALEVIRRGRNAAGSRVDCADSPSA